MGTRHQSGMEAGATLPPKDAKRADDPCRRVQRTAGRVERLARVLRQEQGTNLAVVAVLLLTLLGFAGIAIDGGNAYYQRQRMQLAADAAALAGARVLALGEGTEQIDAIVQRLALENGADSAVWSYINENTAIHVEVEHTFDTYFAHLFGHQNMVANALSEAGFEPANGVEDLFPMTVSCDCVDPDGAFPPKPEPQEEPEDPPADDPQDDEEDDDQGDDQGDSVVELDDNKSSSYRIEFVNRTGNTWTYRVEEVSGRDLSHWSLGIDTCLDRVTGFNPSGAEVGTDGSTGFDGIKWDVGDGFSSGTFSFTLNGDYPAGMVEAMAKAGTEHNAIPITGPICEGGGSQEGGGESQQPGVDQSGSQACVANPLGVAGAFNVFMSGALTQYNTDVEGRVAVAGSASLTNFGVGVALPNSGGDRDDLIVGGSLVYVNGQVHKGNIVYTGGGNLVGVNTPNGTIRQGAAPLDFITVRQAVEELSSYWGGLTPNGSTVMQWGGLTLTGEDNTLNIFAVNGSDLASAHTLKILVPAGSSVLVNVSGSVAAMQNMGMSINNDYGSNPAGQDKVLFNFYEATTLNISGIGIKGSVVAPHSGINFSNGQINGNVIGATMSGGGESHNVLFSGCLPTVGGNPEAPSNTGGQVCVPDIDFNTSAAGAPLARGTIISDQWAEWGVHITSNSPHNHAPMLFDSGSPTGGDTDLGTPNEDFGGPGRGSGGKTGTPGENNMALGKLLIISEDMQSNDPDDNGSGGRLIFTYDQPVQLDDVYIVDIDDDEAGGVVKAYSDQAGSSLIVETEMLGLGGNSFQRVPISASGVQRMEVVFPGSGSVAAVVSCRDQADPVHNVGGQTWRDEDGDGIREDGEGPIEGVELELYIVGQSQRVDSTVSGADGLYYFYNLPAGDYEIRLGDDNFKSNGALATLGFSPRDATSDNLDSDFSESTRKVYVPLPGPSGDVLTVDGGFVPPNVDDNQSEPIVITLKDKKKTSRYELQLVSHNGASWTYRVTELRGRDLSHWNLGIANCLDNITASSPFGADIGVDGSTGFNGIKWDVTDGFKSGDFTIVLDGEYETTMVEALVKAGNNSDTGLIPAPDCDRPVEQEVPQNVCLPTLEFETDASGAPLSRGQIIDDEWASWGIHVTTNSPTAHPAMIFDTADPTGGDRDLGTPNEDFGGPGDGLGGGMGEPGENNKSLGKVLIISEDKDQNDPDDKGNGGILIFTFDQPRQVDEVQILDIDNDEAGGSVRAYSDVAGKTLIASGEMLGLGDNSSQWVQLNASDVRRVEVRFPRSGGVASISACEDKTPPLYRVGDLIWHDSNKNGVQDSGEEGIPGVEVELTIVGQPQIVDKTTTDSDGGYAFENLPAGNYIVKLAAGNFTSGGVLNGYDFTPPNTTSDDRDSDFAAFNKSAFAIVPLNGGDNMTVDGGLFTADDEEEDDDDDGGGGPSACDIGWLDWDAGTSSSTELRMDMADQSRSGFWNIGDLIPGGIEVTDDPAVTDELEDWIGQEVIIPLAEYDGNGYLICGFASVELLDYDFDNGLRWVEMELLKALVRGTPSGDEEAADFGLRVLRVFR